MLLDKKQIAVRQLDTAIKLLFNAGDIVSVHTLASAASTVFADLLKARGVKAWREIIVDEHPGKKKYVIEILRKAERFFKHADRDPDEQLDFQEVTNDEVIFIAILEYGLLLKDTGNKSSSPMSVFQLWYIAKAPAELLEGYSPESDNMVAEAHRIFPDLTAKPRFDQLAIGSQVLKDYIKMKKAPLIY